jgi:hypothetical protein
MQFIVFFSYVTVVEIFLTKKGKLWKLQLVQTITFRDLNPQPSENER